MKPIDALKKKNFKMVYENLYGNEFDNSQLIVFKFKKGDYVRKIIDKSLFEKGYAANWTKNIYIIHALIPCIPPKYSIKNIEGQIEIVNYYKEELQKVEEKKFTFDTIRILDEKDDQVLVQKLNQRQKKKNGYLKIS